MASTKAILRTTASGPIMNLRLNLAGQEKAKQTEEFKNFSVKNQKARYKAIFNGRPYQPMFK